MMRSVIRKVVRSVKRAVVRDAGGFSSRWVATGDGTRSIVAPTKTYAGGFKAAIVWQREDLTGTGSTSLMSDGGAGNDDFIVFDSGHASTPNSARLRVDGVNHDLAGAFAGVSQSQTVIVLVERDLTGAVTSLAINGKAIGNFAGDTSGDFTVVEYGDGGYNGILADVSITDYTLTAPLRTIRYPINEASSPELNVDGVNNWTAARNADLSIVEGYLRIQPTNISEPRAYKQFQTVIGEQYRLAYSFRKTAANLIVSVGLSEGGQEDVGETQSVGGGHTEFFVASSTTTFVTFAANTGNATKFVEVSEIQLKNNNDLDVLAYDENNDPYPAYDAAFTPDADRQYINNTQGLPSEEDMSNPHTQDIAIADGVTHKYGEGGDTSNTALSSYTHHRIDVLTGEVDVSSVTKGAAIAREVETGVTDASERNIYDLAHISRFELTATGATTLTVTSW